jgi:purine-binding chemotaxis protein CheW
MMAALYLIAKINGARVAIESDRVESVVHVHDVIPVPKSNSAVAGLFALRSRVLTLIDSQVLVTGKPQPTVKGALAVIAEIGGHAFGLLVDSVDDVVPIDLQTIETKINPGKEWLPLITGIASVGGDMVMILDPAQLVGGIDAVAA